MGKRDLLLVATVLGSALLLVGGSLRPSVPPRLATTATATPVPAAGTAAIRARVDAAMRKSWNEQGLSPAGPADELALMRRLSLALTGTIPALEEIRRFEAEPAGSRVDAWLESLLRDRRSADYLAERFTRAFVGTEDGPFLLYRRRRFRAWLSDALLANRPYDQVVRDLIADEGLWTDRPATNFISVTQNAETERPDPERLAARVSRAFLGFRLDCAQCHDHPFDDWKQDDFRGLAAFFGAVHSDLGGIRDGDNDYKPPDPKTREPRPVAPTVPFQQPLLPTSGTPRQRLAAWVTSPANPNLARATVNRSWAILFGRPLCDPVDDLPAQADQPEALALLAADFTAHGYDLRRLLRTIAATEAFRMASATTNTPGPTEAHEAAFAAFPLTRLRPEQVAGAVYQSAALRAIGPESFWLSRLIAYNERNDFVRRYGDLGEDEFDPASGTIPQRLLMMNGKLVGERNKGELFDAAGRIAAQAPDDRAAVVNAYLTVLTRRPTPPESAHFAARLNGTTDDARAGRVADMFWVLLNSTEFSWNH